MNVTITVPPGATNHGDPHLLCLPPRWYSYLAFLTINYLAHALTVVSYPGQGWKESVAVAATALVLPVSGITRALEAIWSVAAFSTDPVKCAARAGALCMVAPPKEPGSSGTRVIWEDYAEIDKTNLNVQGEYRLCNGWRLVPVMRTSPVWTMTDEDYERDEELTRDGDHGRAFLSTPYVMAKLLVGLFQAVWASVELYRARGNQIDQYGYAAFGLSVAQYAYMSIINVIGNLVQPEYPSLFMIRTPAMGEAEADGCFFSGELKVHLGERTTKDMNHVSDVADFLILIVSYVLGLAPLAIVGALSRFQPQNSTLVQEVFAMWWLGISALLGPLVSIWLTKTRNLPWGDSTSCSNVAFYIGFACFIATPFVGGIVVVMLMLHDYGDCSLIS